MDPRVLGELERFPADEAFSRASVMGFVGEVRSRIISAVEAQSTRLLAGECRPSIDVSIGTSDFSAIEEAGGEATASESWEEFQRSLIRTEMVACLEATEMPAGEVLQLYVSPEFRMSA